MLVIRIYVCALTLLFLLLVTTSREVGSLEAIVIASSVVFMILDTRMDLKALQADLQQLEQLEQQISLIQL